MFTTSQVKYRRRHPTTLYRSRHQLESWNCTILQVDRTDLRLTRGAGCSGCIGEFAGYVNSSGIKERETGDAPDLCGPDDRLQFSIYSWPPATDVQQWTVMTLSCSYWCTAVNSHDTVMQLTTILISKWTCCVQNNQSWASLIERQFTNPVNNFQNKADTIIKITPYVSNL
jgi:hypothetical protein